MSAALRLAECWDALGCGAGDHFGAAVRGVR